METRKAAEGVPNNYINNIYFPIPKYNIKTKIDYLTISLRNTDIDKNIISNILIVFEFRSVSNKKLDEGSYRFKQSFMNSDNIVIELFYHPKKQYLPLMQMKIHDPNRELLELLHAIFRYHSIYFNLSDVEVTFDFYTDDVVKLREYLKQHLFLRYQRSNSFPYKTTFYTNNIRKGSKGMRVYSRQGWNHARMELVMKSQLLKRLNLTLPLHSIDSLDLSRFFQFMMLDRDKLQRFLIRCNRKQIIEADQRRPGFGNLLRQQINSYVNRVTSDDRGDDESLMKKVENLRSKKFGIPNHSRFFKPLDEFNVECCRQVSSQNYLKSRNKDQIEDKSGRYSYRFSPKKLI